MMYSGVRTDLLLGCRYFVLNDFTVECFDDKWHDFLPYAVIFTLIYPLGVPAAFFGILYKFRNMLEEPATRLQFGFLYEGKRLPDG